MPVARSDSVAVLTVPAILVVAGVKAKAAVWVEHFGSSGTNAHCGVDSATRIWGLARAPKSARLHRFDLSLPVAGGSIPYGQDYLCDGG